MADAEARRRRFVPFAWATLAYTLFVILFGAWVRITGSGAGCGQHWPTCHGEIIHRPASVETVIELTHRLTSSLDGVLVIALVVLAVRAFARGHAVRRASVLALVFVILEGLVGALLVREELVADDDSVARAVVMAIHLVNTALLTAAMAAAAWLARAESALERRRLGASEWLVLAAMAGMLLTSMSGAVTALGDTLYPVEAGSDLGQRLATDQGLTAHFLQRMRILHPLMAVALALGLFYVASAVAERHPGAAVRRWVRWTIALTAAQVGAGAVNILLSAPGWMQIVHLGLANLLWIALVLLALSTRERATP
jgi:heme A synthase